MTTEQQKSPDMSEAVSEAIEEITAQHDADIAVYAGNLFPPFDGQFIRLLRKRQRRRKNLLLILSTPGGVAESAYRIAHGVQRLYKTRSPVPEERGQFIVLVHDYCKSAGTILALGADQLIMSDLAELGPIDVQLRKEEEVGERTSGLNALEALGTLQTEALALFRRSFEELRFEGAGFSTKTAVDVATKLSIGLFQPIYSQIDPIRLGEIYRSVKISQEYGDRLRTQNVKEKTVAKLVAGYPSHEFIIDREEAKELFNKVDSSTVQLQLVAVDVVREAHQQKCFEEITSKAMAKLLNEEARNAQGNGAEAKPHAKPPERGKRRIAKTGRPGGKTPARVSGRPNGAAGRA